jgi:Type II secretion system (T2SS), protein G
MELSNSKRVLYKASYVSTQFTPDEQREMEVRPGGGFPKAFLIRTLELDNRDIEQMRATLAHRGESPVEEQSFEEQHRLLSVAAKIAHNPSMPSAQLAGELAPISYDALKSFIKHLSSIKILPGILPFLMTWMDQRRKISPIGRLHLERIEMYSAGIERGELVFTVPMAAGETITISHKEWSTSSRTYEDIAQDYFESYSEKGVAEKSDASMSSDNESHQSNTLNFGASTSGSYFGVTLTTTFGLTNTNDERASVKQSTQQSREITEKASARVRQEHKVSVKIETKSGTEDRSAKTITNESKAPTRIDYYRMMRKWRTDLYRYGLRLTYDIAIPLPGVRIWAMHQRLAAMEADLRRPFSFGLNADDLNDGNWAQKAKEWGVAPEIVPLPPTKTLKIVVAPPPLPFLTQAEASDDRFGKIDFNVPAGYWLKNALATAIYAAAGVPHFTWHNGGNFFDGANSRVTGNLSDFTNPLAEHPSGALAATYSYSGIHTAGLTLELTFERTAQAQLAWRREAWAAISASATARDGERRDALQAERDRLWRLLNGKNTLALRRLEREELVRLMMQWLLGPDHAVVAAPGGGLTLPPGQTTLGTLLKNEMDFQDPTVVPGAPTYSPTFSNVSDLGWYGAVLFGDFVKFVHQAIEWENILYFMYPYFWGSEVIGRNKVLFEHADPEHERFLRAGYVRVVLPVRPGFEEDFTSLMESGSLGAHSTHPYMTVAEDISNFARTNYAGIPPANPEREARPLLFPEQRVTWDTMQALMAKLDQYKTTNGKYPTKLMDLPGIQPDALKDFWGNPFVYRLPGLGADYDLVSLGANGVAGGEGLNADISSAAGASLVATWFEYTPSSALDIEMNTDSKTIA